MIKVRQWIDRGSQSAIQVNKWINKNEISSITEAVEHCYTGKAYRVRMHNGESFLAALDIRDFESYRALSQRKDI